MVVPDGFFFTLRGRSSRRHLFTLLLASLPLLGANAATEVFVNQRGISADTAYSGLVELAMIPQLPDSILTVSFDGRPVGSALRRPYRISLDLGPSPVEHTIEVVATSADGKRREKTSLVINPGSKPLAIKVRPDGDRPRTFLAAVSVPRGEQIGRVEFYDDQGRIARLESPPWKVVLPEQSNGSVITATVTTRAGVEATDTYTAASDVHSASFDVRTVELMVSLTDRKGARRSTPIQPQLEILDNGTRARILQIGRADELPISIALLIDASASITPEIDGVRHAANSFIRDLLRPQDSCALFAIRTVPKREVPLTSDVPLVAQTLLALKPDGRTAIYDAIRAALRELRDADGRKAVVILTDGEDTSSVSTYEEALEMAKAASIPVYVIAFNEAQNYAEERDRLSFMATETGGFLTTATARDLAVRYKDIERDLREQYAVRYQITDSAKPNQWRDVKVVVKSEDVTARTISGYFTP